MKLVRQLGWPWGVALVGVMSGLAVHGWSAVVEDNDQRLPPEMQTVAWAAALVGIGGLVWAMVRAIRHLRRGPRTRGFGWKVTLVIVLHVLFVLATPVAMMVSDPSFPLGGTYVESIVSPSGAQYYLYRGGFFCGYETFVRDPGAFYLRQFDLVMPSKCVDNPHLVWNAESRRTMVVGPDGRPIVSGKMEGLYWGPH